MEKFLNKFIIAEWDGVPVVGVVKALNSDNEGPFDIVYVTKNRGYGRQTFMKLDGSDSLKNIRLIEDSPK